MSSIKCSSPLSQPSLPSSLDSFRMGICFNFHPNDADKIYHEFQLPKKYIDRLSFLSHSLGLAYNSSKISHKHLLPYTFSGAGFRDLIIHGFDKFSNVLVDVCTYFDGKYGHLLVLVCLGFGCTVWFGFVPGLWDQAPPKVGVFAPIESYNYFFNMDYNAPNFKKIHFVETYDTSELVMSAFANEPPFSQITIPASGEVHKAVSLGIMVAIFLMVGLFPNVSGDTSGSLSFSDDILNLIHLLMLRAIPLSILSFSIHLYAVKSIKGEGGRRSPAERVSFHRL